MTNGEMHEVSRSIGKLEAAVGSLTETWAEQDRKAAEGRRRLYDKVEAMQLKLNTLSQRVDQLSTEVKKIEPKVQRSEDAALRTAGGRAMLAFIWSLVISGVAAVAYLLHGFITLWLSSKPH